MLKITRQAVMHETLRMGCTIFSSPSGHLPKPTMLALVRADTGDCLGRVRLDLATLLLDDPLEKQVIFLIWIVLHLYF